MKSEKRPDISLFIQPLRYWFSHSVPSLVSHTKQHRLFQGRGLLQPRCHFSSIHRIHAAIFIRREQGHRRIANAVDDVVIRRMGEKPFQFLGDIRRAIFLGPQVGDEKAVKPQHVQQRYADNDGMGQIRMLCQKCARQEAAVAAAGTRQDGPSPYSLH